MSNYLRYMLFIFIFILKNDVLNDFYKNYFLNLTVCI